MGVYPNLPSPVVPSEVLVASARVSPSAAREAVERAVRKVPSFLQRVAGTPPVAVSLAALTPLERATAMIADAERIDADVAKADAERLAGTLVTRAVNPQNALYSTYEPQIRSTVFCLCPVYSARYAYSGDVRAERDEACFVTCRP